MVQPVRLLVPGLLGPMPDAINVDPQRGWPKLEKRLHRATVKGVAGNDYESTLLGIFGLTGAASTATAPLRRLGDGAEPDSAYWLQVNPVFLRPDQDRLLVFGSHDLDFSVTEAEVLAAAMQEHFADLGWQLEVTQPNRWYLRLHQDPGLSFSEFQQVLGRSMEPFLPTGDAAVDWHGYLNEIQMLLFTHEVNARREDQGLAPINGVWLSGGGQLPESVELTCDWMIGGDALAAGIAKVADSEWLSEGGELPDTGAGVVIYDDLLPSVIHADPQGWFEAVTKFDAWLERLLQETAGRQVDIILHPCDGRSFTFRRGKDWRFWRRPRPLLQQLNQNQLPT